MDVQVNDIIKMKKPHPCGSKEWLVTRTGMDFRIKCLGCEHSLMIPRVTAEKNIREIRRNGEIIPLR